MEIENLVKTTTIVPNRADIAAVRAGRAAVLGAHKPASTLIVGGLSNPAWKVEVEGYRCRRSAPDLSAVGNAGMPAKQAAPAFAAIPGSMTG